MTNRQEFNEVLGVCVGCGSEQHGGALRERSPYCPLQWWRFHCHFTHFEKEKLFMEDFFYFLFFLEKTSTTAKVFMPEEVVFVVS